MERIVSAGVSQALGSPERPDQTDEELMLGSALNLLGTSFGLLFEDAEHIERALPLYDAVHEHCRVRELPADVIAAAPPLPPLRTPYLRDALERALD